MKSKNWLYILFIVVIAIVLTWLWSLKNQHTYFTVEGQDYSLIPDKNYKVGQKIDSLNGTYVYYNGIMSNISGPSTTADGYNLGQKYQSVEFVKRYYYEHLHYQLPDSLINANDFLDKTLKSGEKSVQKGLIQFNNPSKTKPELDDILIFNPTSSNQNGSVGVVSKITDKKIEIIQQNPGINISSRATYTLERKDGKWKINYSHIAGWLRKE